MEDFYKLCEEEFYSYDKQRKYLYTEETLQEVCLGIHSMCVGAESKYFNGHTNITDDAFLVFGVKGLLDTNKRLKDAMLFNILSFMSNQLRQGQHGGVHRRAVPLPHQHDGNRIYPQRHEACAQRNPRSFWPARTSRIF